MKKILFILICLLMLTGCEEEVKEENKKPAQVNKITCSDVNTIVSEEGAIVVDVRTSEEYNTDHIENAININSETIKYTVKGKIKDLDTPIIVYCQSGRRSAESAKILTELGYTKVYDMGGITACYGEE